MYVWIKGGLLYKATTSTSFFSQSLCADALAQQILFVNLIIDYTILLSLGTMFHSARMSGIAHSI